MSRITLEGVEKRYPGGVQAVDGVSLDISDGEFVTLVGPSGCGKTTTLRMIAGFEQPTAGSIAIAGRDVTHVPPYERNTGMVFQSFALFPHMSVADNVAYGLDVAGDLDDDAIDARVQEMLDLVRLPDVGDRDPAQLSGGQQQRIALARALAPEPDVLLLDEPLASLDKKLREQMQVELRRIQQEVGITTVFVTHNQEEALTMSDRLAVMNDGRFEQVGAPGDVYDRPASRFVADFLGAANLLEGRVESVDDGTAVVDCDGLTLRAASADGVDAGDDVAVVVRPERLRFADASDGAPDNVVRGTVDFRRHLGATIEYHIDAGGRTLLAIRSNGEGSVAAGDDVELHLQAEDCLLLDA